MLTEACESLEKVARMMKKYANAKAKDPWNFILTP